MAPPHPYLMENDRESERLRIKGDRDSTLSQLMDTGLGRLGDGCRVVDAGAGSGFVAGIMGQVLSRTYTASSLVLLDGSKERLDDARRYIGRVPRVAVRYVPANLERVPLKDDSSDYVFSRFVFEYLRDPHRVFGELLRVTRPGGKLVVGDLDYNCLTHYPLDPRLCRELSELVQALHERGALDPYMGRKLYSYYYEHGLRDVKVRVIAHHLFYGDLRNSDDYNWSAKLEQLVQLSERERLRISFDLKKFRDEFMAFLRQPGRFTYTPLVLVEGVKPDAAAE